MTAKWIRRIPGVVALLAIAVVVAYRELSPVTVAVTQPTRGPAIRAVYATGTVEASVTIRIAPRVAGRLVELGADEGQAVAEGQLLARLEDSDLRAAVVELEAKARYAEEQYQRSASLFKRGFVTRDQVDLARADRDAARAAARRATEQLSFMTLKAPAAGVVIRRDGEVGDFIAVNQAIVFLSKANTPARVVADVDEEDVAAVRAGQKVLIKADAFGDRVFDGQVTEITPKGDPVARSYRVRIALPVVTPLMIGMTAETNIVIAERQHALLIPTSALNRGAVWVVREGRLALQPVTIGIKGLERTEIRSGLDDRDRIVLSPENGFKAGQAVRPQLSTPAAAPATAPAP